LSFIVCVKFRISCKEKAKLF